jgi:hypothetical protein
MAPSLISVKGSGGATRSRSKRRASSTRDTTLCQQTADAAAAAADATTSAFFAFARTASAVVFTFCADPVGPSH